MLEEELKDRAQLKMRAMEKVLISSSGVENKPKLSLYRMGKAKIRCAS